MHPHGETHARSIVKALTWRLGGFVVTVSVAWALTHQVAMATSIGLADTLVKLLAFYAHERVWLKIRFGRPRQLEYEI